MTIVPTAIKAAIIVLLALPTSVAAQRGGGHHGGGFGVIQHGHPINAWTGSHRPKLR